MAKKAVVYSTKLSPEMCCEQLRSAANMSSFFPDLHIRKHDEFTAHICGDNRFWVQSTDGSDIMPSRAKGVFEPCLYGRFQPDRNENLTVIECHFAFKPVARALLLLLGSFAAFMIYVLAGRVNVSLKSVFNGLVCAGFILLNAFMIKKAWLHERRRLLVFVKRVFDASKVK